MFWEKKIPQQGEINVKENNMGLKWVLILGK